MALAITGLLSEADTSAGDPEATTGTVTLVAGRKYVVVTECPNVTVSSVTMPGTCPMTQLETEIRGTLTRVSVWSGTCTAGGTGSISVDWSGAVTGSVIHCFEIIDGEIVTVNKVKSNNTDASSPTDVSLTLPNALDSANSAVVGCFSINANAAFTPGTDFTGICDTGYNTPTRRLAVEYDIVPADLVVDGSFAAAAQWAGIAFEIKEVVAGTTHNLTPADTMTMTDSLGNRVTKAFADPMALADALTKRVGLAPADAMALADALAKAMTLPFADSVALTDALAKRVAMARSDPMALSDLADIQIAGAPTPGALFLRMWTGYGL